MTRPLPLRRLADRVLLGIALLCGLAAAAPGGAQEFVMRAFGDSITEGYGDLSTFNGYPARLERRLDQAGYDAVVTEHGVGGETTGQGLSRIDNVLALGGNYLLLMEGTNDISMHVGIESIRFNLDEMAMRAEALGMVTVHGTVIPRIPTANTDSSNARTSALAAAILEMGDVQFRQVADVFHHFESLPNLFDDYYYYDASTPDPVGHPNNGGYIEIATVFFEALRPLLDGPQLQIVPPDGPLAPGQPIDFAVATNGAIIRVEWRFGDGGFALALDAPAFPATYAYVLPGTVTVSATGYSPTGESVTDQIQIQIAGPAPGWSSKVLLIPAVESSEDELVVTDLELANASLAPGIAEVRLLADIDYDTAPPVRRLYIPPGGDTVVEILPRVFGVDGARGGLIVELIAPAGAVAVSSEALLRAPFDDGSDGCSTGAIAQASWNSGPKQINSITLGTGETATVHVVNPGTVAGSVRLDLYDAVGGYIGSGLFDLAPLAARERELGDLFRGLEGRLQPFRAALFSSGVPFSAHLVTADGESVRCTASTL